MSAKLQGKMSSHSLKQSSNEQLEGNAHYAPRPAKVASDYYSKYCLGFGMHGASLLKSFSLLMDRSSLSPWQSVSGLKDFSSDHLMVFQNR